MGNSNSAFKDKELDEYQDLTYLTKKEIINVFNRFCELAANQNERNQIANDKKGFYLEREAMERLEELQVNPFRTRILQVFSSRRDGSMTFEDFLDMMSVFSDSAPKNLKADFAFQIYDFNDDNEIDEEDLRSVVEALTNNEEANRVMAANKLSEEEIKTLVKNVMEEADLDSDGKLSYAEFEHVISKAPDFVTSFRIRL